MSVLGLYIRVTDQDSYGWLKVLVEKYSGSIYDTLVGSSGSVHSVKVMFNKPEDTINFMTDMMTLDYELV